MNIDERKAAVVSSALWAAAGDALGWMTELADERTVSYRTGRRRVRETVDWNRRIGGRFGPTVELPAGTYSDDTQLRLAVSRATRGDGEFDVAAFAKVELPVWLSYSLGGGRGTTAAANNLAKSSVAWFSNFFSSRDARSYFGAGGNGAAMRIQPHVWKSKTLRFEDFVSDVLKDAVTTHGHPVGFCGGIFHALCVAYSIQHRQPPGLNEWKEFIDSFAQLDRIVKNDEHLGVFWIGPWEEQFGSSFQSAVEVEIRRSLSLVDELRSVNGRGAKGYHETLRRLGSFQEATRGSGTDTAVAAASLALCGLNMPVDEVICLGANEIGSDTDTISSMAGAIIGAARGGEPTWKVQDRDYIISEAIRMGDIAAERKAVSFRYPDLMGWSPPATQADAVGVSGGSLWLTGLGKAEPIGEAWSGAEAEWQWLKLEFGQTVLAKRRPAPKALSNVASPTLQTRSERNRSVEEPSLFSNVGPSGHETLKPAADETSTGRPRVNSGQPQSVDDLAAWVIAEKFRPDIVGKAFLLAAEGENAIDRSIALAAVVAKAIDARRKRSSR